MVVLSHSMTCGVRTPFASDGVCRQCSSSFNCFTRRRHHCRRCGGSFCARCSSRRARLTLWGFPRTQVRVCNACHSASCEENDLIEHFLPLLIAGAEFRKHGTIFVTGVRCVLHPSCRRLEYWSPPEVRQRCRGNEVKGCDIDSIHAVIDTGGLSLKVKGADAGSAKTMSLEALDPRTKREWFEALSLLCKYRNVVSSRGFTRHVMDEQVGLQVGSEMYNKNNFEKESLLRQEQRAEAAATAAAATATIAIFRAERFRGAGVRKQVGSAAESAC